VEGIASLFQSDIQHVIIINCTDSFSITSRLLLFLVAEYGKVFLMLKN